MLIETAMEIVLWVMGVIVTSLAVGVVVGVFAARAPYGGQLPDEHETNAGADAEPADLPEILKRQAD